MKVVALIPIKLGSKRVPQKNIKPFYDGTPLMSFIQKTCLDSEMIDEVYIYCSDEAVKPYVLPGVKFLKRPIELDGDDKNANDIIRAFMKEVDADIYVNAHTTSPFAEVATINKCVEKVASGEFSNIVNNPIWQTIKFPSVKARILRLDAESLAEGERMAFDDIEVMNE